LQSSSKDFSDKIHSGEYGVDTFHYINNVLHIHNNGGCVRVLLRDDLSYVDYHAQRSVINGNGSDITINDIPVDLTKLPVPSCKC
jgi:hypothetical protein